MPQYVISQSPKRVVLRNFEGVITTYTEPDDYHENCHCPDCEAKRLNTGVSKLLSGGAMAIEPKELDRHIRNEKRKQEENK